MSSFSPFIPATSSHEAKAIKICTDPQADQYRQDRAGFNKKAGEYTKQVSF
jgi:regulation of enolase protein 1 (concanavalin A-like superfamily)